MEINCIRIICFIIFVELKCGANTIRRCTYRFSLLLLNHFVEWGWRLDTVRDVISILRAQTQEAFISLCFSDNLSSSTLSFFLCVNYTPCLSMRWPTLLRSHLSLLFQGLLWRSVSWIALTLFLCLLSTPPLSLQR